MDGIIALKKAKEYVEESLSGVGALKGDKGDKGEQGIQGVSGADGYSPTVNIYPIDGGHKVTITDATGAHEFDVMDGEDSVSYLVFNATFDDAPQVNMAYEMQGEWFNRIPVDGENSSGIITVDNITYYATGYINIDDTTYVLVTDKVTKLTGEDGIGGTDICPLIIAQLFLPDGTDSDVNGTCMVAKDSIIGAVPKVNQQGIALIHQNNHLYYNRFKVTESFNKNNISIIQFISDKIQIDTNLAPGILLYGSVVDPIQKNQSTTVTENFFIGQLPTVNDAGYGILEQGKKLYRVAYHISSISSDNLFTIVYDSEPELVGGDSNELITIKDTVVNNVSQLPSKSGCIHAINSTIGFPFNDDIVYIHKTDFNVTVYAIDGSMVNLNILPEDGTLLLEESSKDKWARASKVYNKSEVDGKIADYLFCYSSYPSTVEIAGGETKSILINYFVGATPTVNSLGIMIYRHGDNYYLIKFKVLAVADGVADVQFVSDPVQINTPDMERYYNKSEIDTKFADMVSSGNIKYITGNSKENPFVWNNNEPGIYIFDTYNIWIKATDEDVYTYNFPQVHSLNGIVVLTDHVTEDSVEGTKLGYYTNDSFRIYNVKFSPNSPTAGRIWDIPVSQASPEITPMMVNQSKFCGVLSPTFVSPKSNAMASWYDLPENKDEDKYLTTIEWVRKHTGSNYFVDLTDFKNNYETNCGAPMYNHSFNQIVHNIMYLDYVKQGSFMVGNIYTNDTTVPSQYMDCIFYVIVKNENYQQIFIEAYIPDDPTSQRYYTVMTRPSPFSVTGWQEYKWNAYITKEYIDDKIKNVLSFNSDGELVVTIDDISKTFISKDYFSQVSNEEIKSLFSK